VLKDVTSKLSQAPSIITVSTRYPVVVASK